MKYDKFSFQRIIINRLLFVILILITLTGNSLKAQELSGYAAFESRLFPQ